MPDKKNKKNFLNLPKYIGGSKSFREFIDENLRYPQAAVESNTEGTVVVGYDIHDDGSVRNAHVLKGIGHGCDEEAVRVINLLKFEKVKNRGVRVKLTSKTSIRFRLPLTSQGITVSYTPEAVKPESVPEKKSPGNVVYEYTINL